WAGKHFVENQRVKGITRGEAVRKKFVPVLDDSDREIVSESGIQPSRFVGHDVAPEALHEAGSLSILLGLRETAAEQIPHPATPSPKARLRGFGMVSRGGGTRNMRKPVRRDGDNPTFSSS